jgi:hypothetical protein
MQCVRVDVQLRCGAAGVEVGGDVRLEGADQRAALGRVLADEAPDRRADEAPAAASSFSVR